MLRFCWPTSPREIWTPRPVSKSWACSSGCTSRATPSYWSRTSTISPCTLTASSMCVTEKWKKTRRYSGRLLGDFGRGYQHPVRTGFADDHGLTFGDVDIGAEGRRLEIDF